MTSGTLRIAAAEFSCLLDLNADSRPAVRPVKFEGCCGSEALWIASITRK